MNFIGPHVSIAGGIENAPLNAKSYGATGFALFTKSQRQWTVPPLSSDAIARFQTNCKENGYSPEKILPHDSYLINLGGPDPTKRKNATGAFTAEMLRCQSLGLTMLNFHPGSHLNAISEKESLAFIAEGINSALAETESVTAVLENTAGQGSNLGFRFEQLAKIMEQVKDASRVGVCLDTCHLFAAGYDIKNDYERVMAEFDRIIGFKFLRGMHLNDAKADCESHLDRHAPLGKGTLGWEPFLTIVHDPRIQNIPLILETPDESLWASEIQTLQEA